MLIIGALIYQEEASKMTFDLTPEFHRLRKLSQYPGPTSTHTHLRFWGPKCFRLKCSKSPETEIQFFRTLHLPCQIETRLLYRKKGLFRVLNCPVLTIQATLDVDISIFQYQFYFKSHYPVV